MAAEPFGSSAVIGACQYLHIMIELAETTVVSRDKRYLQWPGLSLSKQLRAQDEAKEIWEVTTLIIIQTSVQPDGDKGDLLHHCQ